MGRSTAGAVSCRCSVGPIVHGAPVGLRVSVHVSPPSPRTQKPRNPRTLGLFFGRQVPTRGAATERGALKNRLGREVFMLSTKVRAKGRPGFSLLLLSLHV